MKNSEIVILSMVLILIVFVLMLILIAKDVMDRAALAFIYAMIAFFILISLEHASPLLMVEFLFGTVEDEFLNFHTITLIFGKSGQKI